MTLVPLIAPLPERLPLLSCPPPLEPTLHNAHSAGHDWYCALYSEHRGAFVKWVRQQYQVEEAVAIDAFQEAMLVLYRKSQANELADLSCSLRTYLFAVGRNHLRSHLRVVGRHVELDEHAHGIPNELLVTNDMDEQEREATAELVRQRLAELKPDDRRVLELYYMEGKDMDAVAEAMGLKNRNVAKKKKHFALQRLIALVRAAKLLLL
jgi:RNA polymerase sigma factor (sigma-70 family)